MNYIEYKKIDKKDEKQLRDLIDIVLGGLEKQEFFIPYSEEELESIFDEKYALLHGAYDGDKLVGMAQLYIDQNMLKKDIDMLGLTGYKVCEQGGDLVLHEYRGRGIMGTLIKMQYEFARKLGFDYIISMAHPDNVSSNKALKRLGLEYVKTTTVNGNFLRNIYCMKIDKK